MLVIERRSSTVIIVMNVGQNISRLYFVKHGKIYTYWYN